MKLIHTSFMYFSPSMNLFYVEIGINPIGSSKLKLWHFHATSRFTDFTEEQFAILIFQCLVTIFDTGSLCSFKAKVIRVLFQLESPNSEHRNSSYVQNDLDYSMIKAEIRIWLAHGPTLSEFLGHLEPEFDDVYFYMYGFP